MFIRAWHYLSLRPYWLALLISCGLLLWMLLSSAEPVMDTVLKTAKEENLPKVEITHFIPQKTTKSLTLYGRSQANSRAVIRVKVAGEVVSVEAEKGSIVKNKQNLAVLEKSALSEQLAQTQALFAERLLNYKAAKSLNVKGLQGRARVAEMYSLLLAAKTQVKQLQLQLQRTHITAPFAGILQEQFAEKGDYLQVGDAIFSLENIEPIIIRGDATEHYINHLKLDQDITATLLTGMKIVGKISYIASMADPKSSTFRVEAKFPNPELKIFSGMSVKLSIPLYPVDAIYVSPSVLALDKKGNLGVKLVQEEQVVFKAVELVEADNEGVWLSGFTHPVDIITRGQGFVKQGDRVQAIKLEK